MSKKKDNKINSDFDFDDGLDDFNFDFDFDEPKVKNDRKPILKALEGARAGAKEAIKSSEFIKNAIKDTLPDGFGQTVDFTDSVTQSLKSLYDESSKELKPALRQFKASAAKLVPEDTKALPKSMKDMFDRWKKEGDDKISSYGVNRESLMASVMKETFEAQAKADQAQQQASAARENLKEGVSEVRFKSLMEAVGTAATAIVRIDQYNTSINFKYQQRSLELQYRQLFAMQDTMKFMAEDSQRRDSLLAAIAKNTMLPEFVKIKDSEARMQIAKTKLFESIIGGMYGKRNQYIENAIKGVKTKVTENARDLAAGLREGAFQLDMMGGMSDMPGMDPYELGGNVVGDQGTRWLGRLGGSWLKKKIVGSRFDQRFGISKTGTRLERGLSNLPNKLNEFRENPNYAWEGGLKNSFLAIMQGFMPSMTPDKGTVRLTGKDMDKPHFFTRRTDRSINEVIPGYLSRIFRELQVLRTGNDNVGLTKFDHDSGDFVSAKRLKASINAGIVDGGRQSALKRRLDEMLKMIDPKGTLSPEAKAGLMAKLVENSANVYEASEKRLGYSNAYTKVSANVGTEIAGQMGGFFSTASDEDKLKFERLHNDLAGNMGDPRQYIQQQLDLGNQTELVRLGLIDKKTGQIDIDKIQAMYLSFPDGVAPKTEKRYNPYVNMANAVGEKFAKATQQTRDYLSKTVQETLKTAQDVFIEGEEYPRIRKALLEAGKYKSAVTGKVISTIDELKEPIKDEDGNIVIDEKELPKLIYYNAKDKIPTKLSELIGNTRQKLTSSAAYQNAGAIAKNVFAQAKDTFKKTLTSDPVSSGEVPADVYVDGEQTPRLTAVKMKLGHYFSKVSEKVITKPSEIDGPVIDKLGSQLIDEDEVSKLSILNKYLGALSPLNIAGGLAKRFGRGLWHFQTKVAPRWAANNLKFLFKRIYAPILRTVGKLGWGAIKGTARFMGIMPNQDLYSKLTGESALTGKLLDAGQYISERSGKIIKSLKDIDGPVRDRAGKIVLSLEEFKLGLLTKDGQEAMIGKLKETSGNVKGTLSNLWGKVSASSKNLYQTVSSTVEDTADKKLKNLTPETMRDKIRGTYGQLRKRFGFSREQAEGMETRTLLSQIKDALTPKRKRKNSYEDMQEKGLGNKLTGKEGLASKAAGLASAGGKSFAETFGLDKLMGALSGGKALLDGAKGGAGLLGGALRLGGSLFGGAAATTAAAAATGTVGAAATGGLLSTIGGGLLAAGSATLAFLTAPAVLGAAALALTAYGGYKAYKHYTRDNLGALGKLRMVQYGYRPSDSEHYVNAIDLENHVSKAVVFGKSGGGSIDYSKLEMGTMMAYFGLDFNTDEHKEVFSHWYKTRFEPVFLTHISALKTIADAESLSSVANLTGEKKRKFFDTVKFPEGPYSFSVMPYPPSVKLAASTSKDVQAATAFVTEEMKKDVETKNKRNALIPLTAAGAIGAPSSSKASESQKSTAAVVASKAATTSASALATRATLASVDAEPKNMTVGQGGTVNDPAYNASNGNFATGQLTTAAGPVSDGRGSGAFLRYAPGVSMDSVNNQLRSQFYGAVEEYGRITGRSVTVTDGFRTYEEQAKLKRLKGNKAAMPGTSMHEYGLAIDVDSKALDEMDKLGLLRKYGLTRPVGGEPWHLEAIGTQDNIALYKSDPNAASSAIMAGLGKGGGGLGTIGTVPDNTRSSEHSRSIMAANASKMKEPLASEVNSPLTRMGSNDGLAKIGFKPRQAVLPSGSGYVTPNQYGQIAQQAAANNNRFLTSVGTTDSESMASGFSSRPLQEIQNDPTMRVPDPTSSGYEGMRGTIVAASKLVGVDENLMLKTAAIESDFSGNAGTSTTSAKGLYQFTNDTWKDMIGRHGKKYGYDATTSPMDPKASAIMAAHYFKDNVKSISGSTNRPIGVTEAYISHLLGPGGAKKFFKELDNNPNATAAQVLPDAAAANTSIFYNGNTPRTIGEVYQEIANRINAKARKYGITDSGTLTASNSIPQMGNTAQLNYASYQTSPSVIRRPPKMVAPMVPKMGFQSNMGAAYGNNPTEQQMQSSTSVNTYTAAPSNDLMSKSVDIQSRILDVVSGMYDLMKGKAEKPAKPEQSPIKQTTDTYTPPKPMVDMKRTSMVA